MAKAKRHLMVKGRAACGLPSPRMWTDDPAQVTCLGCKRTLHMADAEVRALNKLGK